jgi:hypothetical protein
MKRLLLTLLLAFSLTACAKSLGSLERQTEHCAKLLQYEQKQFGIEQIYISIQVKHPKDMKDKNIWGDMFISPEGLPQIEILAQEDFPPGMSAKDRRHQQDEIVVHELLHVVLIQHGVPEQVQDDLIEAIRPAVRLP